MAVSLAGRPGDHALNLGRGLGPQRASTLLNHFTATDRGIACRYYDHSRVIGNKELVQRGQRASPIILGSLSDLAFYDVNGIPLGSINNMKSAMPFLSNYLLIPTRSGKLVFISDDHNHAAFAWGLANAAGLIKAGAVLIHIDQHQDNDPAPEHRRGTQMDLPALADYTWKKMEICNFIDAASRIKIGAETIIDNYKVNYILPYGNNKGHSILTAYFDSENPSIARRFDGRIISLERADEVLAGARRENRSVICDIDLDYFAIFYGRKGNERKTVGFSMEETIQRIINVAKGSDFVTIATSPNYFLVPDAQQETRYLLARIVNGML